MHIRTRPRKTAMSILQDLDPKYAKIHKHPSKAWKPAAWVGSLLIVSGCGYWFVTNNQTAQPPTLQAAPFVAPEKTTEAEANRISALNPQATTAAPSNSSATIHDISKQADKAPPEAIARAIPAENSTGSLADAEYRRQAPAKSRSVDTAHGHVAARTERRITPVQVSAKNEKNQAGVGKRANERDVDIITAIVR